MCSSDSKAESNTTNSCTKILIFLVSKLVIFLHIFVADCLSFNEFDGKFVQLTSMEVSAIN